MMQQRLAAHKEANSLRSLQTDIRMEALRIAEPGTEQGGKGVAEESGRRYTTNESLGETERQFDRVEKDYQATFFTRHPDLEKNVIVHHAIEQQVLKRTETMGLFTEDEIHAYENLRGIPKESNSDLHLSLIRKEWNRFYRINPMPTKEDILKKKREIDGKYGELFNPQQSAE